MCARPLDGGRGPWVCAASAWVRALLFPDPQQRQELSQTLEESVSERCCVCVGGFLHCHFLKDSRDKVVDCYLLGKTYTIS